MRAIFCLTSWYYSTFEQCILKPTFWLDVCHLQGIQKNRITLKLFTVEENCTRENSTHPETSVIIEYFNARNTQVESAASGKCSDADQALVIFVYLIRFVSFGFDWFWKHAIAAIFETQHPQHESNKQSNHWLTVPRTRTFRRAEKSSDKKVAAQQVKANVSWLKTQLSVLIY